MGSASTTIGSPVAPGIIMFGRGLMLTPRTEAADGVTDVAAATTAATDGTGEVTPPTR